MPNWIEGTMKLRGKREDKKRFLDNELGTSSYYGEKRAIEEQVECNSDDSYFEYTFKDEPYIKGTRRAFVTDNYLYMEEDEGTVSIKNQTGMVFRRDTGQQRVGSVERQCT